MGGAGRTRRTVLAACAGGLLAGCGFRPMYATKGDGTPGPAEEGLGQISVGLIPERTGQLLRLALQSRFDRGGSGVARRYDLTASYGFFGELQSIEQLNSAPTRYRLVGVAAWSLISQDAQRKTLVSGTARAMDGLNLFNQQFFAMDMETEAVQRRVTDAVADQITLQLAAYFNRRAAGE